MTTDLATVLAALDERAAADPRLEQYRVTGDGPGALAAVPDGWFPSEAMVRIATDGERRAHERLATLAGTWRTAHPCWVPGAMPRMDGETWPPALVAALLGVDVDDVP